MSIARSALGLGLDESRGSKVLLGLELNDGKLVRLMLELGLDNSDKRVWVRFSFVPSLISREVLGLWS